MQSASKMRIDATSGRRILAHNLAHRQLKRQPVFTLLLVRYIAQHAANGQRIPGLSPLAQAQLKQQHASVFSMVSQRSAVDQPRRQARA